MNYHDHDSQGYIDAQYPLDEDITEHQGVPVFEFDAFELQELASPVFRAPSSLSHAEPAVYLSVSDSIPLIENGPDTDNADVPHPSHRKSPSATYRHLSGWRKGVAPAAITATIVLCINIGIAIWATTKAGTVDGIGVLYQGACTNSSQINTGLHLAVNILSTLLLGAGNYTMQCLSSPTRAEVDRAHRQGVWLDVGVPSVRNISRIGRGRAVLWVLLGLSSLPLHLLWVKSLNGAASALVYAVFQHIPV
ncbi:hypothetical protein MMC11_006944 [Xylographa trunciseda]|nr:hypothetical protein [Xylographa trunciseda]